MRLLFLRPFRLTETAIVWKPGRERGLTLKIGEPLECANERVLREFTCQVIVAGQPVRQAVDTVDVRIIQRSFGSRIAGKYSGDQLAFIHLVTRLWESVDTNLHL